MLRAIEGGEPLAIHRTRVATRRLRELLPVLRLREGAARKLGRRLRRVTRRLGTLRELDVLLATIEGVHASSTHSSRMLARVADDIRSEREQAQQELLGRSLVAELERIGRKLGAAVDQLKAEEDEPPHDREWKWAVDARVARRAKALTTAIEDAGALYIPERLHVVRIAVKKLRYAAEVGAAASGIDSRVDLRFLKRAQDTLGHLHDLQMLLERIRHAQASLDPPDPAAWRQLDDFLDEIEQECRLLHARYVRERPSVAMVCARLTGRAARAGVAAARRAG